MKEEDDSFDMSRDMKGFGMSLGGANNDIHSDLAFSSSNHENRRGGGGSNIKTPGFKGGNYDNTGANTASRGHFGAAASGGDRFNSSGKPGAGGGMH